MEHKTPQRVVLQLGAMIAMYVSVSFLLTLLFGIINSVYPDDADTYWNIEQATESVKLGIAMLVVFFPTLIILTRLSNNARRQENSITYTVLTKWVLYLSLLVGGFVLLGTLVTVIYTFLNGELTTRFIMKAGSMIGVVGIAFHYYLLDARNYWQTREDRSIMFGIGAIIAVCVALAFGFRYIETPTTAREMRLDETQVSDLQNIQWQITSYLELSSSTLPVTLEEAYADMEVPTAPEGRDAYSYEITDKGFKLCATFSRDYTNGFVDAVATFDQSMPIKNADNWNYQAGRYCFERVVK